MAPTWRSVASTVGKRRLEKLNWWWLKDGCVWQQAMTTGDIRQCIGAIWVDVCGTELSTEWQMLRNRIAKQAVTDGLCNMLLTTDLTLLNALVCIFSWQCSSVKYVFNSRQLLECLVFTCLVFVARTSCMFIGETFEIHIQPDKRRWKWRIQRH